MKTLYIVGGGTVFKVQMLAQDIREPRRKVALSATFIVPMVHTSWTGRLAVNPST